MRLFISFRSADLGQAEALARAWKEQHAESEVFFSPESLRGGHLWLPVLAEQVQQCDGFLILVGKGEPGPWQLLEYYEALDRKVKDRAFPLVPVLLPGAEPRLPFSRQLHWVYVEDAGSAEAVQIAHAALEDRSAGFAPDLWLRLNPFKGLQAYQEEDAGWFVGREEETSEAVARLARGVRFLMLVGASGVGKSSVLRAGVIPALRAEQRPATPGEAEAPRWPLPESRTRRVVLMRPGRRPLESLCAAIAGLWLDPREPELSAWAARWAKGLAREPRLAGLLDAAEQELRDRSPNLPEARWVLAVDQFEELFTAAPLEEHLETAGPHMATEDHACGPQRDGDPLPSPRRQAAVFQQLLLQAAEREDVTILGTLRSDFYGSLQQNVALFERACVQDVLPMQPRALERVLEEIQSEFRVDIGSGVRSVLERDAGLFPTASDASTASRAEGSGAGAPPSAAPASEAPPREPATARGLLPLFSYFMEDRWKAMQQGADPILTIPADQASGGLRKVLANRAQDYLDAQPPDRVPDLVRLFTLRLLEVPREGVPVRRRARRSECSDGAWAHATALASAEWRLLVMGEERGEATVEVAHEVLLTDWDAVDTWITRERDFLLWRARFLESHQRWRDDRRPGNLLFAADLDDALRWRRQRPRDVDGDEIAYIRRSHRQATRRRRLGVAGLVLALIAASIAGVVFWRQYRESQDNLRQSKAALLVSRIEDHLRSDSGWQDGAWVPADWTPAAQELLQDARELASLHPQLRNESIPALEFRLWYRTGRFEEEPEPHPVVATWDTYLTWMKSPQGRERYPLVSKPQRIPGLQPLGRDRSSGLWEFWHERSGARPVWEGPVESGQSRLRPDSGIILVLLPGGTFWMGAQSSDPAAHNYDPGALNGESLPDGRQARSAVPVTLAPFFIAKHECTAFQWAWLRGRDPSVVPVERLLPAVVSWEDLAEHLEWDPATESYGGDLGLPTEAQWEYACRAGSGTPWSCGATTGKLLLAAVFLLGYTGRMQPVQTLLPNAFALHDVHGNLCEWCADGFSEEAYEECSPREDDGYRSIAGASRRVIRGGGWFVSAEFCRSAFRSGRHPGLRLDFLGFRAARHHP